MLDLTHIRRPSSVINGRTEHVVTVKTFFASCPQTVFDVAVSQASQFWEWMFDLSDPGGDIDPSPNWPESGSHIKFRVKSNVPFVRNERGTISMLECQPPKRGR